jgi:hypothetical protein
MAIARDLLCTDCGLRVDYRRTGSGEEIIGIRQVRSAGGANHVIGMRGTGRWFCRSCADARRAQASDAQRSTNPGLFG